LFCQQQVIIADSQCVGKHALVGDIIL